MTKRYNSKSKKKIELSAKEHQQKANKEEEFIENIKLAITLI